MNSEVANFESLSVFYVIFIKLKQNLFFLQIVCNLIFKTRNSNCKNVVPLLQYGMII